ncbi:putative disease resistance protein RGA4 isoform X1 [Populus nigra]|uniref:putative disease resistance protein RGA4 isoform X1 n=1 Tax=Populus nigra TaxID=3691 RepID=UPI002B26C767|nr:putative disease resistance protein RGA4 isoform X1 [Populus nigra]XP_061944587.1 putative disease resistance protein RGA4 isoform X1 [Populus nigra]XP_061944589.1 putative disease resistance protein RGA4 isoform X1 [Populus nigra]XP_061944590.1 putative disease resistance protein RGA4 isoform X1 [Populus nigra]
MAKIFLSALSVEFVHGFLDPFSALNLSEALEIKGQLERLRESSILVQAMLQDIEERQLTEESLKHCLDLKDKVFDAEDVIDEFVYEALQRKVEIRSQLRKKVRRFFSLSNPILFLLQLKRKLMRNNRSLDKLKNEAAGFGLRVASFSTILENIPNQETDSFFDHPELIKGREADVSKVINLLTSSSNQQDLSVIPIVGMAGIGKTTLAKLVFDAVDDGEFFDETLWVSVSDDFDHQNILGSVLVALSRNMGRVENIDVMVDRLQQELEGKKFLLVLDDVLNENYEKWDRLRNFFLGISGINGSAIIVTTHSRRVASIMETSPGCRYELKPLSCDESWSIISEAVSGNGGGPITSDLEAIGKEIAVKCEGLPLAARAFGRMMRLRFGIEEWSLLRNLHAWDALVNQILLPIKLNYDCLPLTVRRCLVYCSIFPKGTKIGKEQLIELWMAEGFLGTSNERMEDRGNQCFSYLIDNYFLVDVERDELENIRSCKMNNIVHDLASYLSKYEVKNSEAYPGVDDLSHIRYANLSCDTENAQEFFKTGGRKLRSLFSRDFIHDSWNFKSLRTLSLDGADISELQGSIGKLKHLRYLDVSRTHITALPDSITNLYNLQTLRLVECRSLQALPRRMRDLVNLRHIHVTFHHQMPADVGCFSFLQTLPFFIVCQDRGQKVQELESLNELSGRLSIYNLEQVRDRDEAAKANLREKKGICMMEFVWSPERENFDNDDDVIEGLLPHQNIKSLKIENYGGKKFPSWLLLRTPGTGDSFPLKNLVNLKLLHCKRTEELPTLGLLRRLKVLEIIGMNTIRCIGMEFYINEGESRRETMPLFPELKKLSLQCMENLVEWRAPALGGGSDMIVFPYLEELSIMRCPRLNSIPISHLSALAQLEICFCGELSYLSDDFHSFTSLENLRIEVCPNLEAIPSLKNLKSLKRLAIQRCQKLTALPSGLQSCTSLEHLCIRWCVELTSIPDELRELRSLLHLEVTKCPSLNYFPEDSLCCLTRLKQLTVGPFSEKLKTFPGLNSIQHLSSLEEVVISGWDKLTSLPDQLQYITSLKSLYIRRFNGMKALPEWLGSLKCLKQLGIWRCKNLSYLPTSMQQLFLAERLEVIDCPLLKENGAKGGGSE